MLTDVESVYLTVYNKLIEKYQLRQLSFLKVYHLW